MWIKKILALRSGSKWKNHDVSMQQHRQHSSTEFHTEKSTLQSVKTVSKSKRADKWNVALSNCTRRRTSISTVLSLGRCIQSRSIRFVASCIYIHIIFVMIWFHCFNFRLLVFARSSLISIILFIYACT